MQSRHKLNIYKYGLSSHTGHYFVEVIPHLSNIWSHTCPNKVGRLFSAILETKEL